MQIQNQHIFFLVCSVLAIHALSAPLEFAASATSSLIAPRASNAAEAIQLESGSGSGKLATKCREGIISTDCEGFEGGGEESGLSEEATPTPAEGLHHGLGPDGKPKANW